MYEMLFHYYPAFVAAVVDSSRVRIWLQHPKNDHINFELSKTILVDLSKTPSNRTIDWNDIEVDDHEEHEDAMYRGFTTLGPVFPHNYGAVGVYLSLAYRWRYEKELGAALARPARATLGADHKAAGALVLAGRPYEEWAVVRRRGKTVTRFHGFHRVDTIQRPVAPDRTLYRVAHAGTSFANRAPCPVIVGAKDIPDPLFKGDWAHIPGTEKQAIHGSAATRGEAVYISQTAAAAAGLDIPKKPTGSGEGLMLVSELKLTALPSGPERHFNVTNDDVDLDPEGPLNIIGEDAYDEVRRIEQRLGTNRIVIKRTNLLERLNQAGKGPFTSLDLIGHARGRDGLLRMNDLLLGAGAMPKIFTKQVVSRLVDLGISEIRILGCRTATTPAARNALQTLASWLKEMGRGADPVHGAAEISVRGTNADLFAVHYKHGGGFDEMRLLTPPAHGEPAIPPPAFTSRPDIGDFPLAAESSSNPPNPPIYWQDAAKQFRGLWDYVLPNAEEGDPFEEAFAQVLFVDKDVVRAFDLITVADAKGSEPTLSYIRLNFPDAWVKFKVTEKLSPALYALLRGRPRNATQS